MRILVALFLAIFAGGFAVAAEPTRFTVTVTGEGPDVILIPGLSSAPHVYDGILADLEKTHRVHRIQIAGFAGMAAGPNAAGGILDGVSDELIAYIRDNKLEVPAVIGHSMGGLLTLMVAAKAPGLIGKGMVIDALPFFSLLINPMATADMVKPYAEQAKAQMLGMTPEAFEAAQKQTMAILTKSPEGQAQGLADSLASDRAVVAEAMAEVMVRDVRGDLASITAPITVLQAYDAQMPVPKETYLGMWSTAYSGLDGLTLKVIDASYHFIMWDQPASFAEAVTAFLAE